MPIRSNIAVPECPAALPLIGVAPPLDCVPGSINWNRLINSQKFLEQAGIMICEAGGQRINGQSRPVIGFTGSTIFENNGTPVAPETTAEIQTKTIPLELFPGFNKCVIAVTMKLAGSGAMNSQLRIYLQRGGAPVLLKSFRALTGSAFIVGIETIGAYTPFTQAYAGVDISNIIPQAGLTEYGAVILQLRKFNPRGTVSGLGNGYWDGLEHVSLRQYKDCP